MNEVAFTVRMDKALKTSLEELAEKDGRSLNNLIVHLLKCAVANSQNFNRAKEKEK